MANQKPSDTADEGPSNFLEDIVEQDLREGKHGGRLMTRFPPEPNGYLHIGHAKSICLNFSMAAKSERGVCNLRFDDTNPEVEEVEFVESIKKDIRWLGFDWEDREYFASSYFEQLYEYACILIRDGKAYVDSQSLEDIRKLRGDFHTPGINSPDRNRSIEENLDLFERMRQGEFEDGAFVLRAKIDMASADVKMRDPILYRIKRVTHHRTGDRWPIYPMYDFAHGLSDAIEGVTHSLCTLEFQNHRGLYYWFLDQLPVPHCPEQYEFARLALGFTVMAKRKLHALVRDNHVSGWDDPRMPTLSGMRRRGYPPRAIRTFCDRIGVSKRDGIVDVTLLEHTLREDLNETSPRVMTVLKPLRVVLTNFPEGEVHELDVPNMPDDPSFGTRRVLFSRELYVERDDFMDDPPKKWWRLGPGKEVRLRYAALITCDEAIRDPNTGELVELRCTWDPNSKGGNAADGRKVRGTLHWVSAAHAVDAEVRLYDRLFTVENPLGEEKEFTEFLNHESLEVLRNCKAEQSLAGAPPGNRYQFERHGYFCVDSEDSSADHLVFNRTISLRDSWAKIAAKLK